MKYLNNSDLDSTKVYRQVAPHQYVEVKGIEEWCELHPTLSGVLVLAIALVFIIFVTLLFG